MYKERPFQSRAGVNMSPSHRIQSALCFWHWLGPTQNLLTPLGVPLCNRDVEVKVMSDTVPLSSALNPLSLHLGFLLTWHPNGFAFKDKMFWSIKTSVQVTYRKSATPSKLTNWHPDGSISLRWAESQRVWFILVELTKLRCWVCKSEDRHRSAHGLLCQSHKDKCHMPPFP